MSGWRVGLNWDGLIEKIKKHGLRNSLLIAPMPTGSTSAILGYSESVEAVTSNLYVRKILSGDYPMINKYLYKELKDRGLCTKEIINKIIRSDGKLGNIPEIPQDLKSLYKTVWEISQKVVIQMAASRGAFIDQSQSLNISFERPTLSKLTSLYIDAYELGLKTLSYYVRSCSAIEPIKFTIPSEQQTHGGKPDDDEKNMSRVPTPRQEHSNELKIPTPLKRKRDDVLESLGEIPQSVVFIPYETTLDYVRDLIHESPKKSKTAPWCDDHSCCT